MRIAITTAADRSSRVADLVIAAGHVPVLLPSIEVSVVGEAELQAVRDQCAVADLIVVTSSRAITALWPAGGMPHVSCAAVGPVTAAAVRHAGGDLIVEGQGGAAELLDSLRPRLATIRVVLPQSGAADDGLARGLEMAGASVWARTVYRVEPLPPDEAQVDVAIFASPTAVEGWSRSRDWDGMLVAAIGQTTAAALKAAGRAPDLVAPDPTYQSLLSSLNRSERIHS